ncbi:hypothetical protein D3C86_1837370 [compost metagenome]
MLPGLMISILKVPRVALLGVKLALAGPIKATAMLGLKAGFSTRLPHISKVNVAGLVNVGAWAAPVQSMFRQ